MLRIEAGDRSFDINVPEELNRKLVDHTANINIAYTEYSRRNLLSEGIHPSKIFVCGSPIKEVYASIFKKIINSDVLKRLQLTEKKFIVASIHREENVDTIGGLKKMVDTYKKLSEHFGVNIVVSTHPRTRQRIKTLDLADLSINEPINWHEPFGLIDFLALQRNSLCVVSDSGTIHEDSSVLRFPAVAIRRSSEKYECIDHGFCPFTGLDSENVIRCCEIAINNQNEIQDSTIASEYNTVKASRVVTNLVTSLTEIVKTQWIKSY